MKYITLIIGLVVVGCGKQEKADTANPVKELTLEEKVVGTYEFKVDGDTFKVVLLENGNGELYGDGQKVSEAEWKISEEGEMHAIDGSGLITVHRINKDGSITNIAMIDKDKKRTDWPKEDQWILKKIK